MMKIGFNWLFLLICVCPQIYGMQYLLTGNEHKKLAQAIQKDDLTFIQELFAQEKLWDASWIGENCLVGWWNAREHNRPILHTAVKYGSIKIVQLLLEHGFEINYRYYVPDIHGRQWSREYNLPLYYADTALSSKRKPLIHLLVLYGAQLFKEEQEFGQVLPWLHKPACLKTFLQAPRVAPEAPQGTMWQETEERLVALVWSLSQLKKMHKITACKDMRQLLCQYALKVDGPLTERFLLSELCYLAQTNLVDKEYLIEKLVTAHVNVLQETLNTKVSFNLTKEEKIPYHILPDCSITNHLQDTKQLLNPDPEKIREQLGQGIKENYRQLLFGKET